MILELYLKGFIPASFAGISEILYTPKNLLQIIIGTNGSGKSSLLRALSLAPLDRKEFNAGGERRLRLIWNNEEYRLVSHYKGKTAHHEFWMGDTNLNQGGTSSVQKELTETHFGYTAFHHKLLTGKLAFTEMSPNARKDLLVMISGLELDYALEMFEKIRIAHRDTVGALKHLASKYSDAAKQLAAMDDTEELEEQARKITEEITLLMPKTNYSVNTNRTRAEIVELSNRIGQMYKVYKQLRARLRKLAPDFKFRDGTSLQSKDNIAHNVSAATTRIVDVEKTIQERLTEHSKLEEQTAKFSNVPDNTNKSQLEAEVKAIQEEASLISVDCADVGDLSGYLNELIEAQSSLLTFMEAFPEPPVLFKKEDIDNITAKHTELSSALIRERDIVSSINTKIVHAEAAREGNITCHNCETEILAAGALSQTRLAQLKTEKDEHAKRVEEFEKELVGIDALREKQTYFANALTHIRNVASKYPLARNVFGAEGPKRVLLRTRECLSDLQAEREKVKLAIRKQELKKQLEEKQLILSLMEVSGKEKLFERFKQVEKELDSLYSMQEEYKREQAQLEQIKQVYFKMDEIIDALKNKYEPAYIAKCQELVIGLGDEEVNAFVHSKQSRLADMNKIINDYKVVSDKLKYIKEEEEQLAERKQDLDLLMHCLSSKKGVVGQQLHTVISKVSGAINNIIEDVWEKELLLTVPEFGKTLDFQFMTQIEGLGGPDIKDLSEGQKEIVNFAMTMVIMRQLNLTDFPLLLDETSANMDSLHRSNFMNYIRELVEIGEFKSIFLVSHYASEYGGFTNADLVVMNPDNIGTPQGAYNENIELR